MEGPQHLKCASDFSSSGLSCTIRVEGRASQVSAFLDHPGRFYVCGKMDLNTNFFSRGSCLTHPQAMNKHRILSYATVSCRGLFRGLLVHVWACPADPVCFYGRGQTGANTDFSSKNPKIGSRGRTRMGLESGWAHALGCPEWGPPGAGPQEGVLGTWWWCPCCSGPIPAIPAHTVGYRQIHAIPAYTCRYMQIHVYTYQYLGI